ncbi:MAG: hypothetical protein IPM92_08045 [Saprospiraceae bacterium]|nr:hypothetical protein [Saprospiraceae bacterium]
MVYIEKFNAQNKERIVPFTDQLSFKLAPSENYFSIEFSCIDFENQSNHRFSYMLEAWDKEWIDCGIRRYASYSNLNGGQYIFKVRVAADDGQWSDPIQVPVYIDSPFYKNLVHYHHCIVF